MQDPAEQEAAREIIAKDLSRLSLGDPFAITVLVSNLAQGE
jgi:hypothetical protein